MRLNNIRIKKEQHASKKRFGPFWVPRLKTYAKNTDYFSYRYMLTEQTKYDVKTNDQKDWLKLHGVTFGWLNSNDYTAMIGFRYNTTNDNFELNAYYHVGNTEPDRTFTKPLCTVKAGEQFDVDLRIDYTAKTYNWSIWKKIVHTSEGKPDRTTWEKIGEHTQQFQHSKRRPRMVSTWFGGNLKAPKTLFLSFSTYAKYTWINQDGVLVRDRSDKNLD